jgi:hypothetical protein
VSATRNIEKLFNPNSKIRLPEQINISTNISTLPTSNLQTIKHKEEH